MICCNHIYILYMHRPKLGRATSTHNVTWRLLVSEYYAGMHKPASNNYDSCGAEASSYYYMQAKQGMHSMLLFAYVHASGQLCNRTMWGIGTWLSTSRTAGTANTDESDMWKGHDRRIILDQPMRQNGWRACDRSADGIGRPTPSTLLDISWL
jgi:hypothetical protein